ncbi:MAG: hypothetical protein HKP58_01035 [Desulfatitalea sp.]|nr:hypothetical protein [Desulfatitalea sp.]
MYESGRVKIKAPIAANAALGPVGVELQLETPLKSVGTFKSSEINGELELGRRKFKYSAKVEFKVEVTLHPRPMTGPEPVAETVREMSPQAVRVERKETIPSNQPAHTSKWKQAVDQEGVVAVIVSFIFGTAIWFLTAGRGGVCLDPAFNTTTPFMYTIDQKDLKA